MDKKKIKENRYLCDTYNSDSLESSVFSEDMEGGYLTGRAVVTTTGVFPYLLEDGSVFNELRLPEEVFSPESLASLQLKPVTLDHPENFVTAENVQDLQVGTTGEDVSRFYLYDGEVYGSYRTDGTQLSIPLRITKKEAVDAIKNGKRALSCGYTRDLELKSGTWCGIHYDGIQRNIRYNHVAIVDRGRAGDTAVIRMDNAFIPTFYEKDVKDQEKKDENNSDRRKNMKKLTIDSVSFECEDKVFDHVDALTKERDTVQGMLDAANLRIEQLQNDMAGMIKSDDLMGKVREYQAVRDTADKFHVSLDENLSILDCKKAVLKVVSPKLSEKIDNGSEEYINGLFDSAQYITPAKAEEMTEDKAGETVENTEEDKKADAADDVVRLNERLQKKFH